MPDLLLELFSEEIPARMQAQGAENLKKLVTNALVDAGLVYEAAVAFATPRRLTLNVVGLPARQPDTKDERKGPRVGAPEKALEGFIRAAGLNSVDDAQIIHDEKKGDYYLAVIEKPGRASEDVIAEIIPDVIRNFPWPKSMRWGAGDMRWVRPLQSILCTFGPETEDPIVVDFEIGGVKSGNITHGHRFMGPDPIIVRRFEDYVPALEKAFVILDSARRREIILADAKNAAFAQGLELVEDDALLSEVAGLVEWPVVLMGQFDEAFLDVPPEVLTISMKSHQKCFSLRDPKSGKLVNKFILVANLIAEDGGKKIIAGNEKVIAARLSDARFFWEQDLKTSLENRLEKLQDITFHEKLGTQAARVERIRALAREIAPLVGADPDLANRAAQLCKADLVTEMVGEFPDLQGLMGKYYALKAGEDASVAAAIEEHYKPQGPSDAVPSDPVAIAVALADKLDTLVGFWAIDEKPTGSKDPFALRRAALGVIRCITTNEITIKMFWPIIFLLALHHFGIRTGRPNDEIKDIRDFALDVYVGKPKVFDSSRPGTVRLLPKADMHEFGEEMDVPYDLLSFFHDRLKVYLRDTGARHDLIDAVLNSGHISTSPRGGEVGAERRVRGAAGEHADDPLTPTLSPTGRGGISGNDDLLMIVQRVEALGAFLETDDGANLLAGIKRATNMVRDEEKKDACEYTQMPDAALFVEVAETALNDKIGKVDAEVAGSIEKEDFAGALTALASLRAPVDAFFDSVKVNADEPALRTARLNLLNRIRATSSRIANFSKIEG